MKLFVVAFAVVIAAAAAASISSDYLPPVEDNNLNQEYLPPAASEPATPLADDGYRYKVVRRLRLRHRRDVNELPTNEYLPPTEETHQEVVAVEAPSDGQTEVGKDGYRYKVVRRLKYRHRRDVNELPANDYLPPTVEAHQEAVAMEVPEGQTEVGKDGYRYKVVRRLKYRHRRDVSELPANDYLPPTVEAHQEAVAVEAPEGQTEVGKDGYRYKVVRRLKYRRQ